MQSDRKPEFPTPWLVNSNGCVVWIEDACSQIVCELASSVSLEVRNRLTRRIVAAVNAAAALPLWRHRKRGTTYREIGRAELQAGVLAHEGTVLVVYRGEDGKLWARPEAEFLDGRFEAVNAAEGRG